MSLRAKLQALALEGHPQRSVLPGALPPRGLPRERRERRARRALKGRRPW